MKLKKTAAALAAIAFLTACSRYADSAVNPSDSTASEPAVTAPTAEVSESSTAPEASAAAQETEITDRTAAPPVTDAAESAVLPPELFTAALDGIAVTVSRDAVLQTGTVSGQKFSLTINLEKWEQFTTPAQMVVLSRLFWQCYPRMYARFADLSGAPSDVVLAIENEGYGIAEAGGNFIHLHDQWLYQFPEDYDCITHELAHVIQKDWDEDYLEDSGFTERFADCCRYEYALDSGYYNDGQWTLQTPDTESSRGASVRFFVWLDYMYSDTGTDIMRNFFDVCRNQRIRPKQWADAWKDIFAGTKLEGKTADEVWAMFAESDFAYLPSQSGQGSGSDLLEHYAVREKLKSLKG